MKLAPRNGVDCACCADTALAKALTATAATLSPAKSLVLLIGFSLKLGVRSLARTSRSQAPRVGESLCLAAPHVRGGVQPIYVVARQRLEKDCVRVGADVLGDRRQVPRLGEVFRIIHRRGPGELVAVTGELLGHLHVEAVDVAVLVDPARIREADGLNDQRVAFPV